MKDLFLVLLFLAFAAISYSHLEKRKEIEELQKQIQIKTDSIKILKRL